MNHQQQVQLQYCVYTMDHYIPNSKGFVVYMYFATKDKCAKNTNIIELSSFVYDREVKQPESHTDTRIKWRWKSGIGSGEERLGRNDSHGIQRYWTTTSSYLLRLKN